MATASSASATTAAPRAARTPARLFASSCASGLPRLSRKPKRMAAQLPRGDLVEDRDRQTVELTVRALGDDLVEDLRARIVPDPAGQDFPELLTVFGLRRGEDLGPHDHSVSSFLTEEPGNPYR